MLPRALCKSPEELIAAFLNQIGKCLETFRHSRVYTGERPDDL
jgi:hypothetical protein